MGIRKKLARRRARPGGSSLNNADKETTANFGNHKTTNRNADRSVNFSLLYHKELVMNALKSLRKAVSNFHNDERGLEALQVVMILAIAAICLLLVKSKWGAIKTFFTTNVQGVIDFDAGAAPAGGGGGATQ